jgi:hypothetical protein
MKNLTALLLLSVAALLSACSSVDTGTSGTRPLTAAEGRALVGRALPGDVKDRSAWATDMYAAFAALEIPPTPENVCAAVAITSQESGFQVDPVVPGLAGIARKEIARRGELAGVPAFATEAALALPSGNGKSYGERLAAVKTERQLSDLYDDLIGRVPFGRTLLADHNPVRTGGPMQVAIAFAESHSAERPYPYALPGNIRQEVFTRRGGVYFGIAHLLDYPAPYAQSLYRFADFNAGRYASRNAAFQKAVTELSGVPLELDGDLLRYEGGRAAAEAGSTERALRVLARRIDMSAEAMRRDLEQEKSPGFEKTRLYARVFELADRIDRSGRPAPRALLPQIPLSSPKITRKLTTDWFANRVNERHQACMKRIGPVPSQQAQASNSIAAE